MLSAGLPILGWIILVFVTFKVGKKYKKSSEIERKQQFRLLIELIIAVPLFGILLIAGMLRNNGVSSDIIYPVVFISVLLSIFIPAIGFITYLIINKQQRNKFNDPSVYKSPLLYKYRFIALPVTVIIPLIGIIYILYQCAVLVF